MHLESPTYNFSFTYYNKCRCGQMFQPNVTPRSYTITLYGQKYLATPAND